MTKTENKREEKKRKVIMPAGIRNKLVAAISMLMVASIMMVSSTYAWFTLSTAPEVKGITTNVGANGNLEMMLLNKESYNSTADDLGVVSSTNDSYAVQALTVANVKWGNLVDLSDTSYGLNNIVLNPARLNITGGAEGAANTLGLNMLWAPTYGSDGRVIDVTAPTYGGRTDDNGTTWISDDTHAGVRALGTSSGASQRTNAWRAAVAAVASNSTEAKNTAISTIKLYGQDLANIMVGHVQNNDTAADVYTRKQVESIQSLINMLKTANDQAGEAIVQAVLAYNLSDQNADELSDADVTAIINALNSKNPNQLAGLTYDKTDGEGNATPTAIKTPTGFDAAQTKWDANNTAISTSKGTVENLLANENKTEFTYAEISGVVDGLINKANTTVAGVLNPSKDKLDTMIDNIMDAGKVEIVMGDNSGVYANIANLIGNYSGDTKVTISYGGLLVNKEFNVEMSTAVTATTGVDLVGAITTGNKPAVSNAAGTTITLSDTYGYALDFGFRTNAAGSSLQLQTAGVQRVYSGSEAENTQGSGSYMEFKTANTKVFSVDEVRALMSAIRVAFVTPTNSGYDVLGVAKLNITSQWSDALGAFEYEGGTEVGNDGLKADLLMCEYTIENDGTLTAGAVKADKTAITALEQNKAKKITVVVYIDGDIVDNTMVANAQKSMSGKLNLQFSSSAELTPMANARMEAGGENQKNVSYEYSEVAQAGATYNFGGTDYTVKDGYVIGVRKGGTGAAYFKRADAADSTYTQLTFNNYTTALTATSTGDGG